MKELIKSPNFLEKSVLKKKFAKETYQNFLLPKIKNINNSTLHKYSTEVNTKGLKILSINTVAGKGGAAKVAYDFLTKELNKKDFKAKMLVSSDFIKVDSSIIELEQNNPKLHKTLHKASRELGWLDFFNPASFDIPNLDIFKKSDFIHLHNLHGGYFSPFLLPELTALKPTIWTLHDEQSFTGHCAYSFDCENWKSGCGDCPDLDFYPKIKKDTTKFLLQTKKEIYKRSNFTLVCPSNWLANRARESGAFEGKEIKTIYNGINPDIFKPYGRAEAREMLGLPQDKKILLFSASGSFDNPQKGGKYLFMAYDRLKDVDDILFLNIGGDKNTKNKKNWQNIPYIKEEAKMALYYSAADLFIYPSQAETFGLVAAEAMSCQTPVVAFNNTALSEVVDHKINGYLAKNRDVDDFVRGIKIFLNDKEFADLTGQKGREKVLQKFTLNGMVDEYIRLYRELRH